MLQVKHILKKTIIVPGDIAKNNTTEHVRIPKGLESLIEKYKIRSFPPNFYIFSKSGEPGPKPVGNKYMYMHNRKVLELASLNDQDYDLYGWKHTGVIALYQATKDIKLVQAQCRHKDINTTDKYGILVYFWTKMLWIYFQKLELIILNQFGIITITADWTTGILKIGPSPQSTNC